MRYIDLESLLCKRENWGNSDELWGNKNLKKDFKQHFHSKCWYTEVSFAGHDITIDHFRPKAKIIQFKKYYFNEPLKDKGYTWLKNEPTNYRACCIVSNRKTGEGGKSNYFPLAENSPLSTEDNNNQETPLLLDPCKKEDVALLSFFTTDILCSTNNENDKTRVEVTKTIYNLCNTDITNKRSRIWNEVEKTICEFSMEEISNGVCVRRLKDLVSRESEFSACAISAVKSLASEEIQLELELEL